MRISLEPPLWVLMAGGEVEARWRALRCAEVLWCYLRDKPKYDKAHQQIIQLRSKSENQPTNKQ